MYSASNAPDYTLFFSCVFGISFLLFIFVLTCRSDNIRNSKWSYYAIPSLPIGLTLLIIATPSYLFASIESLKCFSETIGVGIFCSGLLALLVEISHNYTNNQKRIEQFEHICMPICNYEEKKNISAMLEWVLKLSRISSNGNQDNDDHINTCEFLAIQKMYNEVFSAIFTLDNEMRDLLFADEANIIKEILSAHEDICDKKTEDCCKYDLYEDFDRNIKKLANKLKKKRDKKKLSKEWGILSKLNRIYQYILAHLAQILLFLLVLVDLGIIVFAYYRLYCISQIGIEVVIKLLTASIGVIGIYGTFETIRNNLKKEAAIKRHEWAKEVRELCVNLRVFYDLTDKPEKENDITRESRKEIAKLVFNTILCLDTNSSFLTQRIKDYLYEYKQNFELYINEQTIQRYLQVWEVGEKFFCFVKVYLDVESQHINDILSYKEQSSDFYRYDAHIEPLVDLYKDKKQSKYIDTIDKLKEHFKEDSAASRVLNEVDWRLKKIRESAMM